MDMDVRYTEELWGPSPFHVYGANLLSIPESCCRSGEECAVRACAMIEVVHFHRKPRPRAFSIERLFSYVRAYLPSDILCRKEVSPFLSGGILRRLSNIAIASLKRGEINHVTGDVHFLALGLPARKTIVKVHDCGFLDSMTGPARIIHSWFWFRLPLAKCQHITAVSEATRSDLVNILGINQIRSQLYTIVLGQNIPSCGLM